MVSAAADRLRRPQSDDRPRRRHRARAGAPRRPRLARLRGGVVDARRLPPRPRIAGERCGSSRCPRSKWPTGCGRSRSSTPSPSTNCSGWRGSAGRCATKPRQTIYQEGQVPNDLHLLLDGRVRITAPDGSAREVTPPAPLGVEEVLEGRPLSDTARTVQTSICLQLTLEEARHAAGRQHRHRAGPVPLGARSPDVPAGSDRRARRTPSKSGRAARMWRESRSSPSTSCFPACVAVRAGAGRRAALAGVGCHARSV